MVTDNATSPLARYVMTLDAVPPGHEPTRINPAAIAGGSSKSFAIAVAINGIMRNCATNPTATGYGCSATRLKSAGVKAVPMPNMITPRPGIISDWNHVNPAGQINAASAARNTHRTKNCTTASAERFTRVKSNDHLIFAVPPVPNGCLNSAIVRQSAPVDS